MVGRERECDDLYGSGEYPGGTICRTGLCRITFDCVGADQLEIVHLIRKRSSHLNAHAIHERATLPGVVESLKFDVLCGAEIRNLKRSAADPPPIRACDADGVARLGKLEWHSRNGSVGIDAKLFAVDLEAP